MLRGQLATFPASPPAVLTVKVYAAGMLGYGLIVFLQGQRRWEARTLTTANDLVRFLPWEPSQTWGAAFISAGMFALLAREYFGLRNLGLYGGALLIGFLGVTGIISAFRFEDASFAGGFLYLVVATAISIVARTKESGP